MLLTDLGVTEAKAKQFARKGIYTVEELTCYLPRRYNDFTSLSVFEEGEPICRVILHVEDVLAREARVPYIMLKGREKTTGKAVTVFWFNQRWN